MLEINITTSSLDEFLDFIAEAELRKIKVTVNYIEKNIPHKKTTKNKELRKAKIINYLSLNKIMTTGDLYRLCKNNQMPIHDRTLRRYCYELQRDGKISMELIEKKNGGYVYLLKFKKH